MLVSMDLANLRPGMFVEAVRCPATVFAKRRFFITENEIEVLKQSGTQTVVVNITKGSHGQGFPQMPSNRKQALSRASVEGLKIRIHREATRFGHVMGALRDGNVVEMSELRSIVQGLYGFNQPTQRLATALFRLRTAGNDTLLHSLSVANLMMGVGRMAGFSARDLKDLGLAGLMHDVGKTKVPPELLNKMGPLTPDERKIVEHHPSWGCEILNGITDIPSIAKDVCLSHHELLDGSGYPHGLDHSKLSDACRIAAVCDVFDALTAKRAYKKPWTAKDALDWLGRQDTKYDREFLRYLQWFVLDMPRS